MRRCYLELPDGRQLHYRRAGSGPTVLMLHPSPLSSAFLQPLATFLAQAFDVIALDTAGYGDSDPLRSSDRSLAPYVDDIAGLWRGLGLERVLLFGNATGAQLAIEFAKHLPQAVAALVLENAAAFSDEERQGMLERYFPDLSPSEDGAHLQLAWDMARQTFQFFPWYDTREAARVAPGEPPRELVQAVALAYLRSGGDYARAYRAAFANERPELLAAVTQPVSVLLWQDSILLRYSRRLQRAKLPANIEFIEAGPGVEARFAAIRAALRGHWETL